jgi:AAHS family 4-hydroxybenzoate transporter-like MFS transporter
LSVGTSLGGVLAASLLQSFGWQAVFVAGGVMPLVLTAVLAVSLPESARTVGDGRVAGTPVAHLFSAGRGAVTLLFWAILFMNVMAISVLSTGLSVTLSVVQHASPATVAVTVGLLAVGGIAGAFALGPLIDRQSFRRLGVAYLVGAFLVGAISFAGNSPFTLAVATFCAGFCVVGGEIAATALAANYYPATIRSTGVGWALGMGRLGVFAGSFVVGLLLPQGGPQPLLVAAAIPVIGAALAAFAMSRLTTAAQRPASRSVAAAG